MQVEVEDLRKLKGIMMKYFDENDVKDLLFDYLDLRSSLFPFNEGLGPAVREIITYHRDRERLQCLLLAITRERFKQEGLLTELASLYGKWGLCPSETTKMVILVKETIRENFMGLLDSLARDLDIRKDDIKVYAIAGGSTRLLVGIPNEAASRLNRLEGRNIGEEGYSIDSVIPFAALDPISKRAWNTIFQATPPAETPTSIPPQVFNWQETVDQVKGVAASEARRATPPSNAPGGVPPAPQPAPSPFLALFIALGKFIFQQRFENSLAQLTGQVTATVNVSADAATKQVLEAIAPYASNLTISGTVLVAGTRIFWRITLSVIRNDRRSVAKVVYVDVETGEAQGLNELIQELRI